MLKGEFISKQLNAKNFAFLLDNPSPPSYFKGAKNFAPLK